MVGENIELVPTQPFHCSPLFKTLPKTSPLHGISKKRLQQRNWALAGALVLFVVLVFVISLVKMGGA